MEINRIAERLIAFLGSDAERGDTAMRLETGLLLHQRYLLVQKGKKQFYLVKVGGV